MRFRIPLLVLSVTALACGGGGGSSSSSSAPAFGGVEYQTYSDGKTRIQFLNDHEAKITWRNMAGSAVASTYTQSGQDVEVTWGETSASSNKIYRMRQLDECQLVLTERETTDGQTHSVSDMYIKADDRCRRR